MRRPAARAVAAAFAVVALGAMIFPRPAAASARTGGHPGAGKPVLVVAQDGQPGQFASVQAAVDAAPAGTPVTIVIEPGTYWGQVPRLAGLRGQPR